MTTHHSIGGTVTSHPGPIVVLGDVFLDIDVDGHCERYGQDDAAPRTLPKLSQETLAEMVGTTRSRVNFFMNKFRRLGFIKYNGGLTVHPSLLSVILHE